MDIRNAAEGHVMRAQRGRHVRSLGFGILDGYVVVGGIGRGFDRPGLTREAYAGPVAKNTTHHDQRRHGFPDISLSI